MNKPLELTVYPKVDRWVPWSIENYKGETVTGIRREYGYETPQGVFQGDEFPEKRLTDAELAAEYYAQHMEAVKAHDRAYPWGESEELAMEEERITVLHRFATRPHYNEQS